VFASLIAPSAACRLLDWHNKCLVLLAGAAKVDATALMEEDGQEDEEGSSDGEEDDESEDGDGPSSSGADPMDEGRGPMLEDDEDEYGQPAKRARGVLNNGSSAKASESLLYSEVGQLNPHAARQQRKARKKAAAATKGEAVAAAQERKKAAGRVGCVGHVLFHGCLTQTVIDVLA
jgi:hypothetical protein